MTTLGLDELPRLRDRVSVHGHDGIYVVISVNSERAEVGLASMSQSTYLFEVPVTIVSSIDSTPANLMAA